MKHRLSPTGMVVVVPALAPGEQGNGEIVAAVVARGVRAASPAVAGQRHQAAGPAHQRHWNRPGEHRKPPAPLIVAPATTAARPNPPANPPAQKAFPLPIP